MWTSLRMRIDLVNVSLELLPIQLFDHQEELVDRDRLPSLAKIDFIKSKFEFESFSDWSKTIDLVSQEVIFEDTRHKGTRFSFILSQGLSPSCVSSRRLTLKRYLTVAVARYLSANFPLHWLP